MAAFEYIALDARGKKAKGVLEADSGRQIRQLLRDRGLMPLEVTPASGKAAPTSTARRFGLTGRLSALDRVLLTRQLATLVGAGVPIEEALQAAAQQSEKQHVRAMVLGIRARVLEGHALASALAEYSNSFSDLYRSTVAAGEQSGFLDKVLENLADYTERTFEASRDVGMALLYPVILMVLALAIVTGLMIFIVPDMVGVIVTMGQELPIATRILIATSEGARDWWWLILAIIVTLVIGTRWALTQPNIRLAWDRQKLSLPVVGRITRSSNAARYANTLSILTSSAVPLVEAMNIAQDVVSNHFLRRRLRDATQKVSEGLSLRAGLEGVGHFPPMFLHMVASGEASGQLDTMLDRVARYQQAEVERIVTTLVKLFEPLMLVFMGCVVMFIVMSILLPILSMNQLV